MIIKHIFTDMDGTLLNNDGKISYVNKKKILSGTVPVTLVSARSPIEMFFAIEELGLSTPQISFNGNLIYEKVNSEIKILQKHTLLPDSAEKLINFVSEIFPSVSLSWYTLDEWMIQTEDKETDFQTNLTGVMPNIQSFNKNIEIYKIMMMTFDEKTMIKLKSTLFHIEIEGISIKQSGAWYLEITSNKKSKADAVNEILKTEGIVFDEIAAIGDGHNDIPLLKMAGLPIVVANGSGEVKEYAKKIVAENQKDGVSEAITFIEKNNRI